MKTTGNIVVAGTTPVNMQHEEPPGYPSHPPRMENFGPPPGFGPPRQSPLEEGEHAGDTDDDIMLIDEKGLPPVKDGHLTGTFFLGFII